jgi:glycosyltransferase involved in cell wall biosynthesis
MEKTDPKPLVTIAIPIHNGAEFLAETIDSARLQTYSNLEILLLENGSIDGSMEIAQHYELIDKRIKLIPSQELLSVERNFTRGIDLATGIYLKILCSDDLIDHDCVEKQVLVLENNPGIATCTSLKRVITSSGKIVIKQRGFPAGKNSMNRQVALRKSCLAGTNYFEGTFATLYRTQIARACSPFSLKYPYALEMDFCARTLDFGDLYVLQEVTGSYRARSNSYSTEVSNAQFTHLWGWVNEMQNTNRLKVTFIDRMRIKIMLRIQVRMRRFSYFFLND